MIQAVLVLKPCDYKSFNRVDLVGILIATAMTRHYVWIKHKTIEILSFVNDCE